ncbi:MAG: class II aldolase/adducin family protein [Chloroflexota bacterium]|nr:class II aldolase/adducin family protein [Chloroflexota bacterium]MDE3193084.1 class II aldolase/adducin family protein [Chloroflexota bacterium]
MTTTTATRTDLTMLIARATRAMAIAGLFDQNGHISVRDGDVAYINDRRSSRRTIGPDHVAIVRIADGQALHGEPPSETALHLACYRARPDVGSAAHFHPLFATAFATAGRPLVAAYCAGAVFGHEVPVFDDPDLIRRDDQGREVASVLGEHRAALLRGHGVVVVGDDVPTCVTLSVWLEESARRLAHTVPLGQPKAFSADEIRRLTASLWQPKVIEKTWTDTLERARAAGAFDDLPGA